MARTHLMDAVPMTFGQEVSGWARAIELSSERIDAMLPRLAELPIGGTAVGTGLNAPRGFGSMVAQRLTARTGCTFTEATNHFEAQSSQDAMVEAGATLEGRRPFIAQDRRRPATARVRSQRWSRRDHPARAPSGKLDHARQGEPRDPGDGSTGRCPGCRQRRDDDVRGDDVDAAAQHGDADHRTQPAVVDSPARQRGHRCSTRAASAASRSTANGCGAMPNGPRQSSPHWRLASDTTQQPSSCARPRNRASRWPS